MNPSLKLSDHFTLAEFERSATATKYGIDNRVPPALIPALQQLCQTILEPLRTFASQSSPLWGDPRGASFFLREA